MPGSCVFCGCHEANACMIPIADVGISAEQLDEELQLPEGSAAELMLEEGLLPCWWISTEPPVCSQPKCRKQLAELKV